MHRLGVWDWPFLSCVLNRVCTGMFCFGRQLFPLRKLIWKLVWKKAHTNKVSLALGRSPWGKADHCCLGCMENVYAILKGWSCQLLSHSWEDWSGVIHILGIVLWDVAFSCWEYFELSRDAPTPNQEEKSNSQGLKKKKRPFFSVH